LVIAKTEKFEAQNFHFVFSSKAFETYKIKFRVIEVYVIIRREEAGWCACAGGVVVWGTVMIVYLNGIWCQSSYILEKQRFNQQIMILWVHEMIEMSLLHHFFFLLFFFFLISNIYEIYHFTYLLCKIISFLSYT
jgi:hypothetical protein